MGPSVLPASIEGRKTRTPRAGEETGVSRWPFLLFAKAAGLGLAAPVVVVVVIALGAAAGMGAPVADVKLQVVRRGPGTISSTVPDKTSGERICTPTLQRDG